CAVGRGREDTDLWCEHMFSTTEMGMAGALTARVSPAIPSMHSCGLDAGDIGFAHFALLARTARALSARPATATLDAPVSGDASGDADPADPSAQLRALAFDERPLLELAREHSVGRFSHECTRARHAYDAAAVLAEQVSAAERNRCEFIPC